MYTPHATGDRITDDNLARLRRLSDPQGSPISDGTSEHVQQWLQAVIGSIRLLDAPFVDCFDLYVFQIGGAHMRWDRKERIERWPRLFERLGEMVGKAEILSASGAKTDVSTRTRRPTVGEEMERLVAETDKAGIATVHGRRILNQLERVVPVGARHDVRALIRLSEMKRLDDARKWDLDVQRHISRLRLIGGEALHLET